VRKQVLVVGTAVVAVTSTLLMLTLPLRAQGRQGRAGAPNTQPAVQNVSQRAVPIKRLPDGTPDIRGTWVRVGGGMNEANAPDSELKAFGVLSEPQGFGQGLVTAGPEGGRAEARVPKYLPNPRPPQGVIDPANRQLPYTPEARAKRLDYAKNMCCPAKSLSYLELSVRCAPPQPWAGGGVQIFQKPGEIAMLFEQNHQTRVFYTDGRPHPNPDMVFFGGHSTGHWEGNDLVVDTMNLDGRAYYGVGNTFAPYSRQLHITERFTVVSDKLIAFVMTYEDPKTFTRPVKVAGYLYPNDEDEELTPEFTCHEGSYSMEDIFGF
jgi:hypothetical protein